MSNKKRGGMAMARDEQIWNEACHRYADSKMRNAFVAAATWADSHPHWIPVEEELPELTIDDWRGEGIFFVTDDGKSHFGFYSNKGVWFSSVYGFNGHQVTHWMPKPLPPRKEE